jgi:hypothetical protein
LSPTIGLNEMHVRCRLTDLRFNRVARHTRW